MMLPAETLLPIASAMIAAVLCAGLCCAIRMLFAADAAERDK